tara:strand:+ start:645 stop:1877 length:1233 start_codon:yes stop_codon:yes gene_type:complete
MKLLVIDTSYNFKAIEEKKLHQAIYSRDLNGFFSKVWSVHPFGDIADFSFDKSKFGKIDIYEMNKSHSFIEGKIGKFFLLKKLKFINFIFSQIEFFFFLKRLILKQNIDFIKANDPHYNSLLAFLLSKSTNVPFLVRVSGNFDKIYKDTKKPIMKRFFIFRFIEKFFERFIFKKSHYVIAPNKDNLEYALLNGLKKEKGSVVRYGSLIHKSHLIDPVLRKEKFFFKNELNLDDDSNYLIYVGRLEEVKRVMDLTQIIKNIKNNQVKLLIVGKGSQQDSLRQEITKNNLGKRIFLLGEKNQEWLSRCLPNASCFVATHTGRALAEASFAGLPAVGYDIDWHSEIIEDGINGYLVETGDYITFAQSILKILNNKELAQKFSNNIRQKAKIILSPDKINEKEIECFKKIKRVY